MARLTRYQLRFDDGGVEPETLLAETVGAAIETAKSRLSLASAERGFLLDDGQVAMVVELGKPNSKVTDEIRAALEAAGFYVF